MKEIPLNDIGPTLRKIREEVGLSQTQVAEAAGISRQHYNGIENKHYTPGLETLDVIASALGYELKVVVE